MCSCSRAPSPAACVSRRAASTAAALREPAAGAGPGPAPRGPGPAAPAVTNGTFVATDVPIHRMAIETPGRVLSIQRGLQITGWAYEAGGINAGLSAIRVYALPVGGGAVRFLGVATLSDARPDVAAR